jgi:hypothetical protein
MGRVQLSEKIHSNIVSRAGRGRVSGTQGSDADRFPILINSGVVSRPRHKTADI